MAPLSALKPNSSKNEMTLIVLLLPPTNHYLVDELIQNCSALTVKWGSSLPRSIELVVSSSALEFQLVEHM
jgi:hypothetical protein